jgi:hypothetical protein
MHMRHRLCRISFVLFALPLPLPAFAASVTLSADSDSPVPNDPTPAYTVIQQALGRTGFNTPDCTHPGFGPHVRFEHDNTLGRIFAFHLHVTPDGDMCLNTNHPRNEIKVDMQSADYLKVYHHDSVSYRWLFRLPQGFQSSYNFTYIHQIKAVDGDTLKPLIAFNIQKGKNGAPDRFQVNHVDSVGVRRTLRDIELTPLLGEWVEAHERITADTNGHYSLTLTRLRDQAGLLAYSSDDIDMWRFFGTTFIRPKWGFYRSVDNPQYLRDDQVDFKQFCLAKGSDECSGTLVANLPVFSPTPGSYSSAQSVTLTSTTSGASLHYTSDGTTPDCSSNPYSAPLAITTTTTLKAIACHATMSPSPVVAGSYSIGTLPTRFALAATQVSASANSGGYPPTASVDGKLNTAWVAAGDGQWLRYDLQAARTVSHLGINWYRGNQGRMNFEIQVSDDGDSYTTVYSGQSSGTTTAEETYDFPDVSARYVRLVGHGNSVNNWNLVAETGIYGFN